MAGYYEARTKRGDKLLEMSLGYCIFRHDKRQFRELYALLRKQGFRVEGFRQQLEAAMKYSDKATAMLKVLEGE